MAFYNALGVSSPKSLVNTFLIEECDLFKLHQEAVTTSKRITGHYVLGYISSQLVFCCDSFQNIHFFDSSMIPSESAVALSI